MILIPLTPSDVNFTYNGKVYVLEEIIKNGDKSLLITATEREHQEPSDELLEPINN